MSKISLIIILFFYGPGFSQNLVESLIDNDCMEHGSASILVKNIKTGEIVLEFDADRSLPTASIQKILSTASALKVKGKNYRYKTVIGYSGLFSDQTIRGDLVIKGSGDPTIGSDHFDNIPDLEEIAFQLLKTLREKGVHTIDGNILVDESALSGQKTPSGWPWADLGNYYGAGHWGINFNNNEYQLKFVQNSNTGELTTIHSIIPSIDGFSIKNEVRTGPVGSGDRAYIYAGPYSNNAVVRGTIPPGNGLFTIRGSITNPPRYFATFLGDYLKSNGIRITGNTGIRDIPIPISEELYNIYSPQLSEIARITNFESVNLFAEALMKLTCNSTTPPSSFECGRDFMKEFWEDQGVGMSGAFIVDGSGLSPRNTSSARTFNDILQIIYNDTSWFETFSGTLPEMGKEGTLKYMMKNNPHKLKVLAKSGYIGRQRSYAGYIFTQSKQILSFCIILDNYSCSSGVVRNRIEKFLTRIPEVMKK